MKTKKKNIINIAKKLKEKLLKYKKFEGLYLYGSRLKGNYRKNSDIDIVAVFEDDKVCKGLKIYGEVLDIELEYNVVLDFHAMTEKELNLNSIFYNELKRGLYYARS